MDASFSVIDPELVALQKYNNFEVELRAKLVRASNLSSKVAYAKAVVESATQSNVGYELSVAADKLKTVLDKL
jgi:hypothetical protein